MAGILFGEESLQITSTNDFIHVSLCVVLCRSSSLPPLSLVLGESNFSGVLESTNAYLLDYYEYCFDLYQLITVG